MSQRTHPATSVPGQPSQRHGLLTTCLGLAQACHPFSLSAVVLLTALVALASSGWTDLEALRLLLVLGAMLSSQLAIGWTNDYLDRAADRRYQREKPLATGRLDERLLPPLIAVALLVSLSFGVALGALPLLFLVIGTSCGLGYDFGLKQTRWSWTPYLVAFAVLPPFVWSSMDVYRDELLVLYAVGAPIVPAIHLANALPDVGADAATGARGSVVRLGRSASLRLMAALLALPVFILLASSAFVDYDLQVVEVTLAAYVVLLSGAAWSYIGRRDEAAFRFVALAGVVFTTGWLSAV